MHCYTLAYRNPLAATEGSFSVIAVGSLDDVDFENDDLVVDMRMEGLGLGVGYEFLSADSPTITEMAARIMQPKGAGDRGGPRGGVVFNLIPFFIEHATNQKTMTRIFQHNFITLICACCLLLGPTTTTYAAEELVKNVKQEWKGDFDKMLERRKLRALVVYNDLMYFLDKATQRGVSYDALKLFEEFVNKKYKLNTHKMHVVFIPVPRDRLLPALREGIGDIAVANLTITPERQGVVDFSDPTMKSVSEVVVTGPASPKLETRDDLAGKTLHVRKSSSYFQSLAALNQDFEKRGLQKIKLIPADEHLEDRDLLEMVNAGLLPMIVVDSHKAQFWKGVFAEIKVNPDITVREGGQIAWAFRKNSPILKSVINQFVAKNKQGTMTGNIILKRYFRDNKWVRNALSTEDRKKFRSMLKLFEQYADRYDFDQLMLIALGYQESQLDQSKRSKAGAIGVMQLLKSTAEDPNVGIPDIEKLEQNIHAGTKYLRFIRDRYFNDPKIDALDQTLFSFASYNAGPSRIARLRKETIGSGLDPNIWFGNVEAFAAKRIGRETVHYVRHIYQYYIAYKLLMGKQQTRRKAKNELRQQVQ